jgi:anti-sigma factor RsiW
MDEGHEMTTEELHDLTAGYALDALSADERAAYESHLGECDECRAELASLDETVGILAYATEGPTPPAGLRDRIVAAARAEPPKVVALRSRRTRYYAAVGAVAAAAALAIGLWAGLSGGSASPKLALAVRSGGVAQLTASHFDAAPEGKIYEIWVIEAGGKPKPAGLFRDDARVALTRSAPKGATVAVTLEDAPMATTPTPPILAKTTVV